MLEGLHAGVCDKLRTQPLSYFLVAASFLLCQPYLRPYAHQHLTLHRYESHSSLKIQRIHVLIMMMQCDANIHTHMAQRVQRHRAYMGHALSL